MSKRLSTLYSDWREARAALSEQAGIKAEGPYSPPWAGIQMLLEQAGIKAEGPYSVTQALTHAGKLATLIFKDAPSLNGYEKAHLNLPEIKIDNRFSSIIGTSSEFIAAYAMHGFLECEPYFDLAIRGARVMDRYATFVGLDGQQFESEACAYIASLKNYSEINEEFTLKICRLAIFIAFFRAGINMSAYNSALQSKQEYILGRIPDVRNFSLTEDIYQAIRFAVQSIMETYKLVKPKFSLNFCQKAFGGIIAMGDGDLFGIDFIGDLKFSVRIKPTRIWLYQLVLYWILKVRTDHLEDRYCAIDKITVLNSRTGQLFVMPIVAIPNHVIFNAETVFIGISFSDAIATAFHSRLIARQQEGK